MITLKSIPLPDAAIVSRHMEDEAVLVHPQRGKVKVLNQVGAEIWKQLDGAASIEEIVDHLVQRYPVERKILEADALHFISELFARELISLENQGEAETG